MAELKVVTTTSKQDKVMAEIRLRMDVIQEQLDTLKGEYQGKRVILDEVGSRILPLKAELVPLANMLAAATEKSADKVLIPGQPSNLDRITESLGM